MVDNEKGSAVLEPIVQLLKKELDRDKDNYESNINYVLKKIQNGYNIQQSFSYEIRLDTIEEAVEDLKQGKLIILLDDPGREGEGDLICAGSKATPEMINFMITHARGAFIAVFMPEVEANKLGLPNQVSPEYNKESRKTSFRLTCDTTHGTSGCSSMDRAQTVRILAGNLVKFDGPKSVGLFQRPSQESDLVRPGHVVPITANPKGLSVRQGHTEAGSALVKLAGCDPAVAADLEMLAPDGSMAKAEYIREFADKYNIKVVSIAQLCEYMNVPIIRH